MTEDLHRISIFLNDEIHGTLKSQSKLRGQSISKLVVRLVLEDIRRERMVEAAAFFEHFRPL